MKVPNRSKHCNLIIFCVRVDEWSIYSANLVSKSIILLAIKQSQDPAIDELCQICPANRSTRLHVDIEAFASK